MRIRSAVLWLMITGLAISMAGCAPTYPKESLKESIIRLCRSEYKIDVKVRTVGKTIAIYIPLEDLMDFTFALTPSATEKLNDVIMSVTRVVLSTDADYDYYCVIAHDVRVPEIQVIIIKYVNDVKRVFLGDISRGEFGKRMIVDLRLSPQSQKERSVTEIFQKMDLDSKWQDQVMNDFFRADPTALGDIGYWNGRFYIKDITQPEFLAEQIAGRIKMEYRDDKSLTDGFTLKSVKSAYIPGSGAPYFKIEILADRRLPDTSDSSRAYDPIIKEAFKVAADVVHGYSFKDFDYVDVINQVNGYSGKVSKDDLEKLRKNKIKFEEIVK